MAFPVPSEFIEAAEAELGSEFPSELRERLKQSNGGEVFAKSRLYPDGEDWTLYSVKDSSDRKRLARSMRENIVTETGPAIKWTGFPKNAIAAGSNGTGDLLVFFRGTQHFWTWDHETGELFEASVNWTGH